MKLSTVAKSLISTAALCISVFSFAAEEQVDDSPLVTGTYNFDKDFAFGPGQSSLEFEDTWNFTLAEDSNIQVLVTAKDFSWGDFQLVATDLNDIVFEGEGTFGEGVIESFSGLLAGDYSLIISGIANGQYGGGYNGTLEVTAVPLPAAAWLFGSALLGLGIIGRKRRLSQAMPA